MTAKTGIQWARKDDEKWAAAFELHLVMQFHPPKGLAHQALSEIHEMVTETGRPAEKLFGEPRQYAASVAAERMDETHPPMVDLEGVTPGERFTSGVVVAGFLAFVLSVVRWARDGLWAEVSWASLVGVSALAAGALALCLAAALRPAGRVRAAGVCWCVVVTLVAGGIAALSALPETALFRLPVPVLVAGAVAVTAGAHLMPDARADRWFTPSHDGDSGQWTRHLDGLLRGRHGMSAKEAREHAAEVRSHLASATETTAQDEFGDVEVYASRLAGGRRRIQRAQRQKARMAAVFALGIVVADFDALRSLDLTSFWFWFGLLAVVFSALLAALRYRDIPRSHRHQ
ncbi:hypothetical protein [Streptomyces sp. NPDC018045]|uniref:hypothetical protein n=1 Tax=Streptomyces sp. NPDC018045 TaxID=3365037 RepID=UPI0037901268